MSTIDQRLTQVRHFHMYLYLDVLYLFLKNLDNILLKSNSLL